jgi:hypothetical protein
MNFFKGRICYSYASITERSLSNISLRSTKSVSFCTEGNEYLIYFVKGTVLCTVTSIVSWAKHIQNNNISPATTEQHTCDILSNQLCSAKCGALTAVLLMIQVFWYVMCGCVA